MPSPACSSFFALIWRGGMVGLNEFQSNIRKVSTVFTLKTSVGTAKYQKNDGLVKLFTKLGKNMLSTETPEERRVCACQGCGATKHCKLGQAGSCKCLVEKAAHRSLPHALCQACRKKVSKESRVGAAAVQQRSEGAPAVDAAGGGPHHHSTGAVVATLKRKEPTPSDGQTGGGASSSSAMVLAAQQTMDIISVHVPTSSNGQPEWDQNTLEGIVTNLVTSTATLAANTACAAAADYMASQAKTAERVVTLNEAPLAVIITTPRRSANASRTKNVLALTQSARQAGRALTALYGFDGRPGAGDTLSAGISGNIHKITPQQDEENRGNVCNAVRHFLDGVHQTLPKTAARLLPGPHPENLRVGVWPHWETSQLDFYEMARNEGKPGFPTNMSENWAVMTQPIKAGMVGCCLSHWVVWFECAKGDAPWVFIGEDDLKLKGQGGHPQNFFTYMSWTVDMLAKKVPNWDILVLKRTGSDSAVGPPTDPEVAVYPDKHGSTLFEAKHLGGQFAYCMSKRACERIVASGLHSAMFCIDDFLSAITVGHFCRKIREHPAVVQVTTNGGMLKMYVDTQAENKFFTRERYATSDTDYPLDGIETHLDWRSAFGSGASAPKGKGKGAIDIGEI